MWGVQGRGEGDGGEGEGGEWWEGGEGGSGMGGSGMGGSGMGGSGGNGMGGSGGNGMGGSGGNGMGGSGEGRPQGEAEERGGDGGERTGMMTRVRSPPLWLTLRRVNSDARPADIPPISLKTPGKWTLLFENKKEAVVRTVFEETGIRLEEEALTPTGCFDNMPPEFFWRVPVYYYVAEIPESAEVVGPRTAVQDYFLEWDSNILRQSPDPIDRTWANYADPRTGCAWLPASTIDTLQQPLKGENYMAQRYLVGEHLPELRESTGIME